MTRLGALAALLLLACGAPAEDLDASTGPDAAPADGGAPLDAGPSLPDGGPPDGGAADAGADAGGSDAGADAAARDAGAADAGAPDAGPPDAGAPDAGAPDGGPPMPPCVDEVVTTVGAAVSTGTTVGMGDDLRGAACEGAPAPDVAVWFTAPATGSYVFDTYGSTFDTVLSLHDADCADPKERACADDTGGDTESTVSMFLVAGASVIVNVDGFDGADAGDYVLNITQVTDPCPDEDLGSSTGVPVVSGRAIDGATTDARTASCTFGGGGGDVAFAWMAPSAGDYTFAVVNATFDSVIYLLDGGCGGEEIECNDDSVVPTEDSTVTRSLTAGQRLVIVVDAFTRGEEGTFDLNITPF